MATSEFSKFADILSAAVSLHHLLGFEITQHSKNEDHDFESHHFMVNRWGNSGNSGRLYFLGLVDLMPFMEIMVKRLNIFENRMMKQYEDEIKFKK